MGVTPPPRAYSKIPIHDTWPQDFFHNRQLKLNAHSFVPSSDIFTKLYSMQQNVLQWYSLTTHNWQKWKRVFLTCPCQKIYRGEAVGLKSCKYTWKIRIYVNMWNLRQFRENWYFVNNCLIETRIWKFFCTCVTHIVVIIWSTAHFVST